MAGRHQRSSAVGHRSARSNLIFGVVLLLVAVCAGVATAAVIRTPAPSSRPSAVAAGCTAGLSLTVVAAPSIAGAVTGIAADWMRSHPVIDNSCPTVTVRTAGAAAEENALARPGATLPDLWIPDSSLWVQRLRTDILGLDGPVQSLWVAPPVASSPLVLTTSAAGLAGLRTAAARGWAGALGSGATVSMVDPTRSTEGLLSLLAVQTLVDGTRSAPSRSLVSTLVGLSQRTLASPAAGLLQLGQGGAPVTFPASEAQVVTGRSSADGGPPLAALAPTGRGPALDFPVVQFVPPGGSPAQRDANRAFLAELGRPAAQARLREAGLRDAAGDPLPTGTAAAAVRVGRLSALPLPTQSRVADALREWTAAGRTNRALAVIDLSGSMADPLSGGGSKIALAAAAEPAAVDFLPDRSSLGLWGFSVNRAPGTDWQELVSLGPLGDQVDGSTRRSALVAAAATLPTRTGGATGLYNTVLAAFEAVRNGYDPAQFNSVVLLTDGANTDRSGVDLASLLSTLRSQSDPARPLPVITVAIGPDADVNTLKQISAATGGATYTVTQPDDIRGAFLDAIIKAG